MGYELVTAGRGIGIEIGVSRRRGKMTAGDDPKTPMRPHHASESADRREFLRSAVRYAGLTGIAGIVAAMVARRAPLNGPACGGTGVCGGCASLNGCQESRAAAARQGAKPFGASP
jgi:hypothetical protein